MRDHDVQKYGIIGSNSKGKTDFYKTAYF